eukprot:4813570-Ditylum_brightwellii.AAC.1
MEFYSHAESRGVSFPELTIKATMIDAMIASNTLIVSICLLVFTIGNNGSEIRKRVRLEDFPFLINQQV